MCGALCLAVGPMLTHARPDVSDGIPTRVLKTATTSHSMSPLFVPWFIWAPASGPSAAAAGSGLAQDGGRHELLKSGFDDLGLHAGALEIAQHYRSLSQGA